MSEDKKVSELTELALGQFKALQQNVLTELARVAAEDEGIDLEEYRLDPNRSVWVKRDAVGELDDAPSSG